MPDRSDNRDDPHLLLAAVLDGEGPSPELLAAYVDDPAALSPAEREAVERAEADDPMIRAEIRALRTFRFPAARPERSRARRRSWWWTAGTLAAAAASLALYLGLGAGDATVRGDPSADGARERAVAQADPDAEESRLQDDPLLADDATARARDGSVASLPETRPDPANDAEAQPELAPERVTAALPAGEAPAPEARPRSVEPSRDGPDPARTVPSEASVPATGDPARPRTTAASDPPSPSAPASRPTALPTTDVAQVDPDRGPTEEPAVLVAVLDPRYRVPAGAPERLRIAGSARGGAARTLPAPRALAPAHVARTSSAAPPLFWILDEALPPGATARLTLQRPTTPEPDLEAPLAPGAPGIQRISLADLGVVLEPGAEYVWSVSIDVVGGATAVTQGWIRRVETDPSRTESSEQVAAGSLPARYAQSGLWYDALAALADLEERFTGDARICEARRSLVAQVDLVLDCP